MSKTLCNTANRTLLPLQQYPDVTIGQSHSHLRMAAPCGISTQQMHAFDYFRQRTVHQLSGCFSKALWERLVLQISHQQPAVLHAVVAVGSMHRAHSLRSKSLRTPVADSKYYRFGLNQYCQAITLLQSLITKCEDESCGGTAEVVLLVCLLFVAFEMLQGQQELAITHLRRGLQILWQNSNQDCEDHALDYCLNTRCVKLEPTPVETRDIIASTFIRLDFDSTMFGVPEPYLTAACQTLSRGEPSPPSFSSIEAAKVHLDSLASASLRVRGHLLWLAGRAFVSEGLIREPNCAERVDWASRYCAVHAHSKMMDLTPHHQLYKQWRELLGGLASWSSALAATPTSEKDALAMKLLRIQHFNTWYIAEAMRDTRECSSDRFESTFATVVELADQYIKSQQVEGGSLRTFSLEPGVMPSLYLVALKCRTSVTRRRAISLLRNANVQEGLWQGSLFATFLDEVVMVEEERARELTGLRPDIVDLLSDDVPEAARFNGVIFAADPDNTGRLVCSRFEHEGDGRASIEEHLFPLVSIIDRSPKGLFTDTWYSGRIWPSC